MWGPYSGQPRLMVGCDEWDSPRCRFCKFVGSVEDGDQLVFDYTAVEGLKSR